jgi:hypothetical protein
MLSAYGTLDLPKEGVTSRGTERLNEQLIAH